MIAININFAAGEINLRNAERMLAPGAMKIIFPL